MIDWYASFVVWLSAKWLLCWLSVAWNKSDDNECYFSAMCRRDAWRCRSRLLPSRRSRTRRHRRCRQAIFKTQSLVLHFYFLLYHIMYHVIIISCGWEYCSVIGKPPHTIISYLFGKNESRTPMISMFYRDCHIALVNN